MIRQAWVQDRGRVQFFPTSYRLTAGHRLRLAVAAAHFPVPISALHNPILTVYRSGRLRSRMRLPLELDFRDAQWNLRTLPAAGG